MNQKQLRLLELNATNTKADQNLPLSNKTQLWSDIMSRQMLLISMAVALQMNKNPPALSNKFTFFL